MELQRLFFWGKLIMSSAWERDVEKLISERREYDLPPTDSLVGQFDDGTAKQSYYDGYKKGRLDAEKEQGDAYLIITEHYRQCAVENRNNASFWAGMALLGWVLAGIAVVALFAI